MLVLRSFGTASVLAVALAMPALAQTKPAAVATASPLAAESTSATGTAHMAVTGPAGTLHKVHGMWRSSALVGATVYSDSGQAIGTISNLLIRSQGDVSGVVISVGGFRIEGRVRASRGGCGCEQVRLQCRAAWRHQSHADEDAGVHVPSAILSPSPIRSILHSLLGDSANFSRGVGW